MTELIYGAVKFNNWLFAFNIFMLLVFLYQWYNSYKITGRNLDMWYYNMLLIYVIPIILMYPFASSDFNIISVGITDIDVIQVNLDEAYIVTMIGFISIFFGKFFYDRFGINIVVDNLFYIPFKKTIGKYYGQIIKSNTVSYRLAISYIFILTVFVSFTISQGFVNNPRAFFMANPQFRPFYNLIISLFGLTFGIMTTRILQYNLLRDKLLLLPIIVFGFFLGVRAPIIFQTLGLGVSYVIYKRGGYIPVHKMFLAAISILILVVLLVFIRNSGLNESIDSQNATAIFFYEIFYGNTFSDVRDFSWVIGYWDRAHLWGLSYLSAFLSFIPSSLFPFREKWGIGKVTVNMVGFDPTIHPGLRPGFFGEMYLNFDIIGVIIFGFIWGQIMSKVNSSVNRCAESNNVVEGNSILIAASFVSFLPNTAGFFSFYVNFVALLVLYLLTKIRFVR